jgi:hypothetical protein
VLLVFREVVLKNAFVLGMVCLFFPGVFLLSLPKLCAASAAPDNALSRDEGNILLVSGPEDDSTLQWFVVESAHFRVLYPVQLQRLSLFISNEAEKIFYDLTTWTGYSPKKKIDVLLSSRSDFANGYVAKGSRGLFVTIYAVHPYRTASTGLDAYREWYSSVLLHELSHVFHIELRGGLPLAMSKVFGNVIYPNSCTPPFYIEGFAVYSETVNQHGYGRADSPMTEMYIRTACLQDTFPSIDLASNNTAVWPMGQTRYVYGGSFVQHLADEYGENTLFDFNRKSGSCLLYTWWEPFRSVYGRRANQVWNEWKQKEQARSEEVVNRLKTAEVTEYEPLSGEKGLLYSLSLNPQTDSVAYSLRPVNRLGGLYLSDLKTGKTCCIKKGLCAYNIRFSKDGSKIFYLRSDIEKNIYIRSNIYELDLRTGREKRITTEGGVQGFSILKEGNRFLVCRSSPWGTEVGFFDSDRKNTRFLCAKSFECGALGPGFLLEDPVLSPDGRLVAFSFRDARGTRGVCCTYLHDLEEGHPTFVRVTDSRYRAYSPCWLDSGELMFVGDENGVYNLYTVNILSGETRRRTNVLTGMFEPCVSENAQVVCGVYSAEGFQVSHMHMDELDTVYWEQGAKIEPVAGTSTEAAPRSATESSYNITPYKPGRWLLPGGWLPFMTGNGVGFGIGFSTYGNDLLKKHEYSLGLVYDLYDAEYKSVFYYAYNSLHFSYFGRFFTAQASFQDGFGPYFAFSPGISYVLKKRDFVFQTELAGIFESPYEGIAASLSLASTKQSIRWIGPDRGIIFEQGVYHNPQPGKRFTAFDTSVSVYSRPFGVVLLNFRINSKIFLGEAGGLAVSGYGSPTVFAPLNPVYTVGYPEEVEGSFGMDFRTTLGFPLLYVERGIHAFPLYFTNVTLNGFYDAGITLSDSPEKEFVAGDLGELLSDPFGYIRASVGTELEFHFLIGYHFPLRVGIGYVQTYGPEGESGVFAGVRTEVKF